MTNDIELLRQKYGIPQQGYSTPSTDISKNLAEVQSLWGKKPIVDDTKSSQATFPAKGNESPAGVVGHTLVNIPSSALHFGKGVIDFLNPLNTIKTAQQLGTSAGEALGEGANPSKLVKDTISGIPKAAYNSVVPQFLHHIFSGDLQKAAATIENDPIGQIAPLLLVARGAAEKVGKGAEFDKAISTMASPATKTGSLIAQGAGNAASQVLGASTGTGASSIKAAAEGTPAFTDAMRGKTTADDVVQSAQDVVQNIKIKRGSEYTEALKKIGEDKTTHDISPVVQEIPKQLENFGVKVGKNGELDFSRSSIANNGSARADIEGVYNTIKDWGKQSGDRTGVGLDILKKQLADFYSPSGQARAFVQAIKSKVDGILGTQVPGYKEMTGKYAKASNLLDDIKSATGVGGKANADTIFTKLTTAMKGDKEFRLEVLKEMENAGEPELMDKIAGTNMQSFVPKGLVGKGIDVVTAYQLLRGAFSVKFLPMLLSTSPRIVGEFVRALGLGAEKTTKIMGAINKLAPLSLDLSPGATAQENQEQGQPLEPMK
jgi:hypothetical protein